MQTTLEVPAVQCMHCDRTTGSFILITREQHDGGHGPDVWVCLAHRPRVGAPRRHFDRNTQHTTGGN